jgi:membrane protein YdbS with pleckstrin-like domain
MLPDPAHNPPLADSVAEPAFLGTQADDNVQEPSIAVPALAALQPLDRRVVALWRVVRFIVFGVFMIALMVGAVVVAWNLPPARVWLATAWVVLLLAGASLAWWFPARSYRGWGYRIDDQVLETHSGVVFRVTRLLPLPRLQHVDLQRGPLERAFGLASLVLHTAGTHEATIVIPGLDADEAARLRDQLVRLGGDDGV